MTTPPFDLWQTIRAEAAAAAEEEPMLASFLHLTVLRHTSLYRVLAFHLSSKLASPVMDARALLELFREAYAADSGIIGAARADCLPFEQIAVGIHRRRGGRPAAHAAEGIGHRLSDKAIAREVSQNWNTHISYAEDGSAVEIVLLEARANGAFPLHIEHAMAA